MWAKLAVGLLTYGRWTGWALNQHFIGRLMLRELPLREEA